MENKNKIGRYPKDHPRAGGYVVFWANQTLNCEKFKHSKILGDLVKAVCVAQLVDFTTGRFEKAGIPFTAQAIANRAGITGEDFNNLVGMDLISKQAKNGEVFYSVKSWLEHQNPKHQESAKEVALNQDKVLHLSNKRSATIQFSSSAVHHSAVQHSKTVKSKYDGKSRKVKI